MHASDCDANASFSSTTCMSEGCRPAFSSALSDEGTGPIPMKSGCTPAGAADTSRASGFSPRCFAFVSDINTSAVAPSFKGDALPAVTDPFSAKAGFSLASASSDVSGRGPSSSAIACTGTISSARRPDFCAAIARWWLRSAKASWSSRDTSYFWATRSAVSPICSVPYMAAIFGLTRRHPSAVSKTVCDPRAKPAPGLDITHGERVMLSTPPATMMSAPPDWISRAAAMVACIPDPQRRFTV